MNTNNIPNSFQFPNWLVDHVMYMLTAEENVLVTFTVRHIFGWEKERLDRKRPISITMFERGYADKSGNRYAGTGLSRNTIIKGMRKLVDFGIFIEVGTTEDGTIWEIPAKSDVKWQELQDRYVSSQKAAKDKAIKGRETLRKKGGSSDERGFIPSTSNGSSDELNQTNSNLNNDLSNIAKAQLDKSTANANRVADNEIISLQSLTAEQADLLAKVSEFSGLLSCEDLLEEYSDSDIEFLEDHDFIEKDITPYWNHCRYRITAKGKQALEPIKAEKPVKAAKKGRKPAYVLTDSDKEILQFVDASGEDMAKAIEQGISQIKLGQLSTLVDNGYLDMRGVPADAHFILTDKGRKTIGAKKPVSDKQLENNRKADIALAYGEWLGTEKDIAALRNMTKTLAESLPDLTGQELKDFFSVQTGLNKNLKRMDSIMRELVIWRAAKAPDGAKNTSQDMLPVEQNWYRE